MRERDPEPETARRTSQTLLTETQGEGEECARARASVDLRERFKRERGRPNRRGKRWAQRGRRVDRPPCVPRAALPVPVSVIHIRTMGRIEQKKKKCMGARKAWIPVQRKQHKKEKLLSADCTLKTRPGTTGPV